MRAPSSNAVAYVVRSKRLPRFRRCGIEFTMEAQRVDAAALTPAQREHLLSSDPKDLEVEEVVAPPPAEVEEAPQDERPRRGRR